MNAGLGSDSGGTNPDGRTRKGKINFFNYLAVPFIAAAFVIFVDALGILLTLGTFSRDNLVIVMFLEGGIGLIAGVGISLSSTPFVSAAGERLFGTSPWSGQAERHAERVGWKWLIGSTFLILVGFVVSAV